MNKKVNKGFLSPIMIYSATNVWNCGASLSWQSDREGSTSFPPLRFHLYSYGLPQFDMVTDHEALKVIYSGKSKPSTRIERWVLRLQLYNCQVCHVPSKKKHRGCPFPTDLDTCFRSVHRRWWHGYVHMIALHAVLVALRIKAIERVSPQETSLTTGLRVASSQEMANRRKMGQYSKAVFASAQCRVDFCRSCDSTGNKDCYTPRTSQESCSLAHERQQGVVKTKET